MLPLSIHERSPAELDIQNGRPFEKKYPQVSIGMPVYNGEPFIRKAIDSLINQTFKDFELIISDNSSTDCTEEICRQYAEQDIRIRYVRQSQNIGATANFEFVLDEALGKYFMWAAADDVRSHDFIELNLKFLMDNRDYVASTSPVRFEGGDFNPISMGDFSLCDDDKFARVFKFYNGWHANGRFYSLILREYLIKFPYKTFDYIGADWVWVIYLALNGKLNRHENGWLLLGTTGMSNTTNIFKKYNISFISFLIPFLPMFLNTVKISMGIRLFLLMKLFLKFFKLNLQALKLNILWAFQARKL